MIFIYLGTFSRVVKQDKIIDGINTIIAAKVGAKSNSEAFEIEYNIQKSLNHENIVKCIQDGFQIVGCYPNILLELIDG